MEKIRRNDPCPCGSGKKFKKCHLGHEADLIIEKIKAVNSEIEEKLVKLPEVHYGRSKEILEGLTLSQLAEEKIGIKFIDLNDYLRLIGVTPGLPSEDSSASQIVNINKTRKIDPDHIYIAVTPTINDSTLIHQIAHVLCFLKDAVPLPGTHAEISEKTGIPLEHLDHPQEFGQWLEFLSREFKVELDAEDKIIAFLKEKNLLLSGEEITSNDLKKLTARSTEIFAILQECRAEIDDLIKNREGYIGKADSHSKN
jgi:hypothetical protein